MPVLNEERHLAEAVGQVLAQADPEQVGAEHAYPGPIELVIGLGPSTDRTDDIAAELRAADPRVRTVPNPSGRTPSALNAAISATRYEIIVRVDGHGILTPGYIKRAVELLDATGADNIGGLMWASGTTPFERAVACAMTSKLGVGNARFHTGGDAGPADTVYLGVFRRATLEKHNGYDERFIRAQDWELNHRIRAGGGLVWFTPELSVTYRPRPNVRALGRQYLHYGRWRRVVMRTHEGTASIRYLAPPAAVLAVTLGTLLGLAGIGTNPWLELGWLLPGGYLLGVLGGALAIGRSLGASALARLPAVLATMHMCWGYGFLTSRPRSLVVDRDADPGARGGLKR
jgi:glycosyltransferase involved in cell wall biosynthesis